MRRQDIQLRSLARQGDCAARLRLAKNYLTGADATPRNIPVGLDYALAASTERPTDAARLVAESLALQDLLAHGQLEMLARASASSASARIKLAIWQLLTGDEMDAGMLLRQSGAPGIRVFMAWQAGTGVDALVQAIRTAFSVEAFDDMEVALMAARRALDRKDLARATVALALAASLREKTDPRLYASIVEAVHLAEHTEASLDPLGMAAIHASLDHLASQGDIACCFLLGRALCGVDCGALPWQLLAPTTNVRKGSAYLLRAADAGIAAAWLHLFRVSADYRSSAANAQMSRFCLEKASLCGIAEAQRRLGALRMREAVTLHDAECAVELLYQAAQQGDVHASALMCSLVLAISGQDDDAEEALLEVRRADPWLAARLSLSRAFGLTKLEALTIDPVAALRPWGIVIGPNPYVSKARLSAPRAIPAVSLKAIEIAREAAALFRAGLRGTREQITSLRQASANQRRLFERLHIDESLFFSAANSSEREAMRLGSRWAHRCRSTLRLALEEAPRGATGAAI